MLIVVDRVVDNDYCSVVNIDNQIHWLQDMSGEETPKRSSSESISATISMAQDMAIDFINFGEFLITPQITLSFSLLVYSLHC